MTQTSYFWQGISQGDAINHPLRQDQLALFFSLISQMDRTNSSIIWTKHVDYDGKLFADIAGTTITVEGGAAIIDGTFYLIDAQQTKVKTATDKIAMVLIKAWTGLEEKTIQFNFMNVIPGQNYFETQVSGDRWDIHIGGYAALVPYSEDTEYYPGIGAWVDIGVDNLGANTIEYLGGGFFQAGTLEMTWGGGVDTVSDTVVLPIGANIDYDKFFAFCTIVYDAVDGHLPWLTSIKTPPLHGSFDISVYTYDGSFPAGTFEVNWLVFCKPMPQIT